MAVVGVPDATYLEVGCAVVVPTPSSAVLDPDELEGHIRQFLASRLTSYKRPRHYVFVDELLINASGKILKHELRARYESVGSIVSHGST